MSKNILQDIVRNKNSKKKEILYKRTIPSTILKRNSLPDTNFIDLGRKKNKSYYPLWFVALFAVVFLFFTVSLLFSNATITVNPKTKDFIVNQNLTATNKSSNTDGLSYDLVVLSGEDKKEVVGGEEKNYTEYAKGTILVYNAFSTSAQTLSADTKLEGSNGKIYKTKSKITIPGMTKSNDPGKIGVDIYALQFGEEYNSTPLDFKISSFKGTSKYGKFYARSVGDITGGLKGLSRQVSDVEKENIINELKNSLSQKLLEKAKNQIPKDFILLKDATFINVDESNIISAEKPDNFIVSIKGTFTGVLFNKDKLIKEVLNESLSETDNKDAYIFNIENLSVSALDQSTINLSDMKDINFNLSGAVKIVWNIDGNKIVGDLLGKSKKDFEQILLKYPNIDSASSVIKPFWEGSFPDKAEKIKVIINSPR